MVPSPLSRRFCLCPVGVCTTPSLCRRGWWESERCYASKLGPWSASVCTAQSRKAKTLFCHGLVWPTKASTPFILGSSYFQIDINPYQRQCRAHGAGVVLSVGDFSKLKVGGGWSEAELSPDEIYGWLIPVRSLSSCYRGHCTWSQDAGEQWCDISGCHGLVCI